jgi:fatty acid-binding protein DegV
MLHIVTDSYAHDVIDDEIVTVVPNRVTVAGKTYLEGIELGADDALRLITAHPDSLRVQPPTTADYAAIYKQLRPKTDGILSIHASRALTSSWENAMAAAKPIGQYKIDVIDSRTFSAGQAMLVRYAVRAIRAGQSLEQVARVVRGAIERVYSIFFVETMDFLLRNAPGVLPVPPLDKPIAPDESGQSADATKPVAVSGMSATHAILGTLLGIKPILTVEDGRLMPIEKVRTRLQGIDRLVEFAAEFEAIDDAMILTHRHGESSRALIERLTTDFPNVKFHPAVYTPSLAALIGLDALGLVILEKDDDDEL